MATSLLKSRVKALCWTLYDYEDKITGLREYAKECDYMVFGYEKCPTTGRLHLQGYLNWTNARTYPNKEFRRMFPGIHDEVARGSPLDNRMYCLKIRPGDIQNEKYEEFGVLPRQGNRTDWQLACSSLRAGKSIMEVIEDQPSLTPCIRALMTMKQMSDKSIHRTVNVIVLSGPPGSGKSRWAYDNYPGLYSKPNGKWWDGYQGEKTILLDDFYGDFDYSLLLKVCDRYPLQVQVKGGFVPALWDTVIITSNAEPRQWYSSIPDLGAFLRRVKTFCINSIPQNADEEIVQEARVSIQEAPRSPSSSI